VVRGAVHDVRHADRVKRLLHPGLQLGAAHQVGRAEGHVVPNVGHEQLVGSSLEGDAHAAPDLLQVLRGHRQAGQATQREHQPEGQHRGHREPATPASAVEARSSATPSVP